MNRPQYKMKWCAVCEKSLDFPFEKSKYCSTCEDWHPSFKEQKGLNTAVEHAGVGEEQLEHFILAEVKQKARCSFYMAGSERYAGWWYPVDDEKQERSEALRIKEKRNALRKKTKNRFETVGKFSLV